VILFEALAEMIVANGEFPRRIHLRFWSPSKDRGRCEGTQTRHYAYPHC
jgi:hypothetical protein